MWSYNSTLLHAFMACIGILYIDFHLDLYPDGEYYGELEMACEEVVVA
jgi:hypothetical protein